MRWKAAVSLKYIFISVSALSLAGCLQAPTRTLVTIADARTSQARTTDIGEPGDSAGDILTFDQPLLDSRRNTIGRNSGFCIRTQTGHAFQCQWTLSFADGTIQVAGREYDSGPSALSIVGGSGHYAGIRGEMESRKRSDGTFLQTLRYRLP